MHPSITRNNYPHADFAENRRFWKKIVIFMAGKAPYCDMLKIVHPAVSVLFLNQSVPVKDLIIGNNAKEAANQ
ncbi:hypothetical protein CUMW_124420 [Citrus unshiu]|nr:hypothetical protein CUMW_124420 [Citrus unshiu]